MYEVYIVSVTPKPAEITHKRYTHIEHGYVVIVINVSHYHGDHGFHTVVEVKGSLTDKKRLVKWSATAFLAAFKPKGRKLRVKSRYELLMGQDSI